MISTEILKLVIEKEKERDYVNKCVSVDICPECGSRLARTTDDHGFTDVNCTSCKFLKILKLTST